jgi:hypothetical protein
MDQILVKTYCVHTVLVKLECSSIRVWLKLLTELNSKSILANFLFHYIVELSLDEQGCETDILNFERKCQQDQQEGCEILLNRAH